MATLNVRILVKTGLLADLDDGDLLDGEVCYLIDENTFVVGYGGLNFYPVSDTSPDLAAIEALTGLGFPRRIAADTWTLTWPAPGDLLDVGANVGDAIIWNGTVWGVGGFSYTNLDDVPGSFPPSTHTHPLGDLEQGSATEDQVVVWRGSGGGNWIAATITLDMIGQSLATDGQVPVWDNTGGEWVPGTVSVGSVDPEFILQGDAVDGDILQWDDIPSEWTERSPDAAGIVTKAGAQSVPGIKTFTGGASGATADAMAQMIVENDGDVALQFLTPDDGVQAILFGTPTAAVRAAVKWDDANESLGLINGVTGISLSFGTTAGTVVSTGDTGFIIDTTDSVGETYLELRQDGIPIASFAIQENGGDPDDLLITAPKTKIRNAAGSHSINLYPAGYGSVEGYSSITGTTDELNGEWRFGEDINFQGRISYEGQSSGKLYIQNTYDHADGDILLQTRTTGTDVTGITIKGSGRVIIPSISLGAAVQLTIASGAITKTGSYHRIETEAGAGSDDLITIDGGNDGDILYLFAHDATHDVVLKDGVDNIELPGGDYTMSDQNKTATLLYRAATSKWHELYRS